MIFAALFKGFVIGFSIAAPALQKTKELDLEEMVNMAFKEHLRSAILRRLDAILLANPSFTLSPFNKIRRAIVEDEHHLLTNSSLLQMLQKEGFDTNEEVKQACLDLAYQFRNPNIYSVATTAVSTSEYSLNFLWVNLNPQNRIQDVAETIFGDGLNLLENAECIKDPAALRKIERAMRSFEASAGCEGSSSLKRFPYNTLRKITESFLYRISKWADVHPRAQINIWYDSALVTKKALQKTSEMVRAIAQSRGVNLRLRDIRLLPSVQGEIEHCLHPGTPVFFRVDFLKVLIADHMISSPNEIGKYCVVSDVDVKPMPPEQLFDKRTVSYLSSSGYVFNRASLCGDFENSFFIFNREKEDLRTIHHKTMIQNSLSIITEQRYFPVSSASRFSLDSQFIFTQYYNFRKKMGEELSFDDMATHPRKVVEGPSSQFNFGGFFSKSDHRSEIFRFIGSSNIPFTRYGRNPLGSSESQIEELIEWKAEPLESP